MFNSEKKKTKLNYEKRFQVRNALDFQVRGVVSKILREQGNGASVPLLAPPPPASSIDFVLPSILRAASHAGRIKFDHQPLFEKGVCAPPPSSDVDWTQVSGGNRAWVAWVRIRKQIFVREHLLRRLEDRMHT